MPKFLPLIMIVSLTLTIFIEVIISLILRVNKYKDIINLILINILTNPLIVAVTYYAGLEFSELYKNIILFGLEIFAFFIEGTMIKKYLSYDRLNPYLLSLVLNVSSFVLVSVINLFIY